MRMNVVLYPSAMTRDDFLTADEKARLDELSKAPKERRRILDRARKRYLYWLSKNPQPLKD